MVPSRNSSSSARWGSRRLCASSTQGRWIRGSETIALGIQLGATLVLMDERDGRNRARRQGLRSMGVVGVLLLAKERGLIPEVRPRLDALHGKAGFWLSDPVYRQALASAGEQR